MQGAYSGKRLARVEMVGAGLIYLPERPFEEERFIRDVQKLLRTKTGIVVVVSEGLKDKK